jgi:hypothetical protein
MTGMPQQTGLRVLYVGDGGDRARLARALAEASPSLTADYTIQPASLRMPSPLRHLHYLKLALHALVHGRRYDRIFFWQQYVALYYSVLARLLPFPGRPDYLVYYIISKKRPGLLGRLATGLFSAMIRDKRNRKTFFMSKSDYLYTLFEGGAWSDRLEILNDLDLVYPHIEANRVDGTVGDTIFSGGSGNRKYRDVAEIASLLPDRAFAIASREEDVAGLSFPGNVTAHSDVYGTDFMDRILTSELVLIPLADMRVMSGQLVCIQAFASGKIVLISENDCLKDWIPTIGSLDFVKIYASPAECAAYIGSLDHATLIEKGRQARAFYEDHLVDTGFYQKLASAIATRG